MRVTYSVLGLLSLVLVSACNLPNNSSSSGGNQNVTPVNPTTCPSNYVLVPGSVTFGTSDFCIAKYEAKQINGLPESQAAGTPWVSITRDHAIAACQLKGSHYALVDNAHWMTVARNIESVTWNWGGDASNQEYGISRGVTNNPDAGGALEASADDNDSCHLATQNSSGTPAVCDLTTYDVARRVQKLDNGNLIWDFAGNAAEWISDDYTVNYGINGWILNLVNGSMKDLFGAGGTYPAGPANPTGNIFMNNFGYLGSNVAPNTVVHRGGGWNYGRYAGIYSAFFVTGTTAGADNGFRCFYSF